MKEKHVILRMTGTRSRVESAIPFGFAATGLAVDVDILEKSEIPQVAQNREVVAVAPVIPMKLIEPFAVPAATPPKGVSWGVQAVGAETSPFSGDGIVVAVLDTGIDNTHA